MLLKSLPFLLSLGLLTGYANSYGQAKNCAKNCTCTVSGEIVDATTGEAVAFATVKIIDSDKGVLSNAEGHFEIRGLCVTEVDIEVSHIGYKRIMHHHDIYHPRLQVQLAADEVVLESIIVEGESTGAGLLSLAEVALEGKKLDEVKNKSLGDALATLSGVSTLKTGQNIVKPVVHGLHSNRVLIINNGVRHEFQNWGAEHAPEIDPSLVDKLSVVKGAATVRYGPDALGGVILIDAPPLELHEDWNGEVSLSGNTNGRSGEGSVELHKGFDRTAFFGQASWIQQGDLSAPDYQLTNTGKKEWSAAAGARYHWPHVDLNVYYSHFNQELGILRASVSGNLVDLANSIESEIPPNTRPFSYDINNPRQTVEHDLFKLQGKWNGDHQSLDVQYAFQLNKRKEFDVRRGANNQRPGIDLELISHILEADWKHANFKRWEGNIGVQAIYQDNNNQPGTNTVPFIPNYNVLRLGAYLIESLPIGNNWVEVGLRYDYQNFSVVGREPDNSVYKNELTYQNASFTTGYRWKFSKSKSFRTNLGTAWRAPNVSELYSFGRHQSSIDYGLLRYSISEANLVTTDDILTEEERPVPSEIGVKWVNTYQWKNKFIDAEVTAYVNYIDNYIYSRPGGITQTVRGAFPFFLFDQADALFFGLDVSSTIKHSGKWKSEFNGNYLWARDIENNDNFVALPPVNLAYRISFNTRKLGPFRSSEFTLDLGYTFQQFQAPRTISVRTLLEAKSDDINIFAENAADFDFIDPPDGYFLAGFLWRSTIGPVNTLLRIDNLLNVNYRNYTDRLRYFADDAGINVGLTLSYAF
ncbi:TonB-dependent receptor [Fulvivirga sp. M361]|uniref:TonB-dependent receptor n=1 Tax=Fulvivirga sp. M361 TaxID=2594266 RepID=UPI00117A189C|nr:TonB-dependent receptor [Fulvivirga sp. M361]TRX61404.1 TonB-dependent receptor [Fulvivirga sp. M361]